MNTNTQMHVKENRMAQFLVYLREEYYLYERMFQLCQKEHHYIEEAEHEKLQRSLAEKKKLLDEVVRIEDEVAALKEEWLDNKEGISEHLKSEITAFITDFKELMETLLTFQKKNEKIMYERNIRNVERLNMIRKGKHLGRAYSAYGKDVPHSRYMDKRK